MPRVAFAPIALTISVAILLPACGRKATLTEQARHYDTRGIARGFSPDRQTIEIQHEDVPGFMPSMTMSFSVRNRKEIVDLKTGDAISFRMTVTDRELLVDHVKTISAKDVRIATQTAAPAPASPGARRLREGDTVPSFSVTNQDGKPVSLETFRGRPFVLTFVFTRCPIAKFCPLMSNNFAELQQAIKTGAGKLATTRLLSITLDPAFDTPQILKQYSANLKADPAIWTFATGEPKEIDPLIEAFSVYRQTKGGTISHGLATALINSDRTIKKIWRGNGWIASEVAGQIEQP